MANSPAAPLIFNEFFETGLGDEVSPFLTPQSRHWAHQLELKAALFSAFLLFLAFLCQVFLHILPLSHVFLVGVYFLAGLPALIDSVEDLTELKVNIDVLMTLAAFASVLIGSALEGGLLLVLFAISGAMEEAVTAKAKGAVSSLYKLTPTTVFIVQPDGTLKELSVKDVAIGTRILIKPGEVIPLDGKVVEGASSVNLVHLTGENAPVLKQVGDTVPGGAKNLEGVLHVIVTHSSLDSTVARIVQLVTQAQEARPRLQKWFDRMSPTYAKSIIGLTIFFIFSMPFFFGIPFLGLEGSVYRSLAFLIAASPCALIIATPIAYLSALSVCAKRGILLKGGTTLDGLADCSMIAFDKTGTLTMGQLSCIGYFPLEKERITYQEHALPIAYALEQQAVHPIAHAVVEFSSGQGIHPTPLKEFRSIPGYGLEATAVLTKEREIRVAMGSHAHIVPKLSPSTAQILHQFTEDIHRSGDPVAILVIEDEVYVFRFTDTPRPHIQSTIQALKKEGLWRLAMLTGDHPQSAQKIAYEVGIDDFYADLRPEDKLRFVDEWSQTQGLAMVGDGINDAPALARATVGICMGQVGSATAVEAADVVLLHDNLELLSWLMKKGRSTQRIVKQNLFLAFGVILLATMPALLGWIPLWLAVVLHEGGTLIVGLNALRLLD